MLRRTLAFAGRSDGAGEREITGGPYAATRLLDGYGALAPAPPETQPIAPEAFALASPSPATPPGLYERAGVTAAIDAARPDETTARRWRCRTASRVAGLRRNVIERPLAGWLFGAAALLLALDLIIALMLDRPPAALRARCGDGLCVARRARGVQRAARFKRTRRTPMIPTQTLRLAYVRTGDAQLDRTSQQGLEALERDALTERTSVEPGAADRRRSRARRSLASTPSSIGPRRTRRSRRLSDQALANLDRYLAIGGMLLGRYARCWTRR